MVSLPVLTTSELEPFIEPRRDAVTAALSDLLGISAAQSRGGLRWRLGGFPTERGERAQDVPERVAAGVDEVEVFLGEGVDEKVVLSGLLPAKGTGPEATGSLRFRARFELSHDPEVRARAVRVKASLGRPAGELAPLVGAAVRALRAYEGFRDSRDEEFRKISSAPAGRYGTLRLGYRCNQDCHFCWQDREGEAPPEAQYHRWLDEMGRAGVNHLNITGGEPTTYAVLPTLIERAKREYGMAVGIQSNAISLAQPKYLEKLVAAGLDAVMTSYHCADSDVSDEMTRAPGTHVKTRAGIANALAAGLLVTLTCVVERRNVTLLEAQARDIVERFVRPHPDNRPHRVTYAHPTSYHEPGLWQESQLPFDVVRPHLVAAARVIHAAGVPVQVTGTCGFPRCMLHGAPELIAQQPLQREIFDEQQLKHLGFVEVCERCTARDECFGLRAEYRLRFGGRGLLPFHA